MAIESAQATVVAVTRHPDGVVARVELDERFACARCAEGRGCGAGLFGAGRERPVFEIPLKSDRATGWTPAAGDRVELTAAPGTLLEAAALAYGLPLAGAAGAALLAGLSGAGDFTAVLAALVGLVAAFVVSRRLQSRRACGLGIHALPAADRTAIEA